MASPRVGQLTGAAPTELRTCAWDAWLCSPFGTLPHAIFTVSLSVPDICTAPSPELSVSLLCFTLTGTEASLPFDVDASPRPLPPFAAPAPRFSTAGDFCSVSPYVAFALFPPFPPIAAADDDGSCTVDIGPPFDSGVCGALGFEDPALGPVVSPPPLPPALKSSARSVPDDAAPDPRAADPFACSLPGLPRLTIALHPPSAVVATPFGLFSPPSAIFWSLCQRLLDHTHTHTRSGCVLRTYCINASLFLFFLGSVVRLLHNPRVMTVHVQKRRLSSIAQQEDLRFHSLYTTSVGLSHNNREWMRRDSQR